MEEPGSMAWWGQQVERLEPNPDSEFEVKVKCILQHFAHVLSDNNNNNTAKNGDEVKALKEEVRKISDRQHGQQYLLNSVAAFVYRS